MVLSKEWSKFYVDTPYIHGIENWVGTETTTNDAFIPSTDISYIAYIKSNGGSVYWSWISGTEIILYYGWFQSSLQIYKLEVI